MKCPYCGTEFEPAYPNQKYCGESSCTKDRRHFQRLDYWERRRKRKAAERAQLGKHFIIAKRELKRQEVMDSLFEVTT